MSHICTMCEFFESELHVLVISSTSTDSIDAFSCVIACLAIDAFDNAPRLHTHVQSHPQTTSPKDSETHFKVVVVSSQFDSVKSPIQRHRLINSALEEELAGPVHALSIVAKSPAQWEKNQQVSPSPSCKGGDGSLPKRSG